MELRGLSPGVAWLGRRQAATSAPSRRNFIYRPGREHVSTSSFRRHDHRDRYGRFVGNGPTTRVDRDRRTGGGVGVRRRDRQGLDGDLGRSRRRACPSRIEDDWFSPAATPGTRPTPRSFNRTRSSASQVRVQAHHQRRHPPTHRTGSAELQHPGGRCSRSYSRRRDALPTRGSTRSPSTTCSTTPGVGIVT